MGSRANRSPQTSSLFSLGKLCGYSHHMCLMRNVIIIKKVKMCLKAGIFWQWDLFPTAGTFMLIMGIIPTARSCLFFGNIYFLMSMKNSTDVYKISTAKAVRMLHYQTTSCPQLCQINEGHCCTRNTRLKPALPHMPLAWLGICALPPHPTQASLPGPEMALTASPLFVSLSWTTAQSLAHTCKERGRP